MKQVWTIIGPVPRDRLVTKDVISEDDNARFIATEWYLKRTPEEIEAEFQKCRTGPGTDLQGYREAFLAGYKLADEPVRRSAAGEILMPQEIAGEQQKIT